MPIHHNSIMTAMVLQCGGKEESHPCRSNHLVEYNSTSQILIRALICHQKREINLFSPFSTEIALSFHIPPRIYHANECICDV